MNIIVLAGGTSDEREVSLRSGAAVVEALTANGHAVQQLDPASDLHNHIETLQAADKVFIALHGSGGEDGIVQSLLEEHAIPFVGSGSDSSALCFDKYVYSELLRAHDVLQPKTELVTAEDYAVSALSKSPHVLKPNDGGSSIDTYIIRDVNNKDASAIAESFTRHTVMLLQELVVGTEITVGVLGDTSLPVIEIIPPSDQEFDYENKYNGATQELCPPLHVSEHIQKQAQNLAVKLHLLCGCKGMSRTDILIRNDELYVLETNTIPGLTNQSLLPKAAQAAGLSMQDLCEQLISN